MSSTQPPSAALRGRNSCASRARIVLFTLGLGSAACASAPEPPATPRAVVQLSKRYDHLTASLDRATAEQIVERRLPEHAALEALRGLTFLRDVIADAAPSDADDAALPIDVQGRLEVHAPCPGWAGAATPDEAETGFVELTLGVSESRVQRAFTGIASGCQFVAEQGGKRSDVTASMTLELDLGASFAPGTPLPPVLMRASGVELAVDGQDLAEQARDFSMRVADDDVLETLIELEALDLGQEGTFLFALRDDGRVQLRGRDDEWLCGRLRSDPCVRTE